MTTHYVGWDVGAWYCDDPRGESRDAVVVLKGENVETLEVDGQPQRRNLRDTLLNERHKDGARLLGLGQLAGTSLVIAIDAVLGWPRGFRRLLQGDVGDPYKATPRASNPFLYRGTEMSLYSQELRPLSVVEQSMGSQSTKAIFYLNCSGFVRQSVGTWRAGSYTAIETYPAAARRAPAFLLRLQELLQSAPMLHAIEADTAGEGDLRDALTCALTAAFFTLLPTTQEPPGPEIDPEEGWIWVGEEVRRDLTRA